MRLQGGDGSVEKTMFLEMATDAREVRVVVQGAGEEVRTPIWIVTVGPSVFVRSYRGAKGHWYQHVLAKRTFPLEIGVRTSSSEPSRPLRHRPTTT